MPIRVLQLIKYKYFYFIKKNVYQWKKIKFLVVNIRGKIEMPIFYLLSDLIRFGQRKEDKFKFQGTRNQPKSLIINIVQRMSGPIFNCGDWPRVLFNLANSQQLTLKLPLRQLFCDNRMCPFSA